MTTWFVYLLRTADGKVYTGCTNDIDERIRRHNSGLVEFTRPRLPIQPLLIVTFFDKYRAYDFERYLKSGSGKEFSRRHFL